MNTLPVFGDRTIPHGVGGGGTNSWAEIGMGGKDFKATPIGQMLVQPFFNFISRGIDLGMGRGNNDAFGDPKL